MINQKWISKPGAIPHIQHFYQPQHEWLEWMEFQTQCVNALLCLLESKGESPVEVTVKIDDKMSVKVAHPSEHRWAVGYKTGPLLETYDEIDDYYHDKPYVAEKLRPLLDYSPQLFNSDDVGVEMQMGFLAYDPDGVKGKFKTNVLTYDASDYPASMILSAVSATRDGKFIPNFATRHPFLTAYKRQNGLKDLRVVRPTVLVKKNQEAIDKVRAIIENGVHLDKVKDTSLQLFIKDHIDSIQKFFNSAVRNGKLYDNLNRGDAAVAFIRDVNIILPIENVTRTKTALDEVINLSLLSHYISQKVMNVDKSLYSFLSAGMHEGLVFTKFNEGGASATIAKMVDPAYTKANFDMWSKK